MRKVTIRAALAMFCAAMLLFAAEAARAASPAETGTPPSDAKPDSATAEKPDEDGGSPSAASGDGESGGTVRLKDLVSDGFVIRTTVFGFFCSSRHKPLSLALAFIRAISVIGNLSYS